MKNLVKVIIILILVVGHSLSSVCGKIAFVTEEKEKPNIILVFIDDLGYGDFSINGSKLIDTPNIDRMAQEGIKLTQAFASANLCTPSRAGLLTGRYPVRTGLGEGVLFPDSDTGLPPEEITIAEILKEQGYATSIIGKWHLGDQDPYWPTNHGFDYYYGLPYSNDMLPLALYRNKKNIEEPVNQSTITERYVEETTKFISENQDQPFFIYLAHTMPHTPLLVSEKFKNRSNAGLYGDVVETIDWGMGEIFKKLKELKLDKETLVIVTSDHGPWYEGSTAGLRARKGLASYEGGFRVPFLAVWPGQIPAGATSDAITMNIDLFPTLIELAGGEVPQDRTIDGKNIWDVLKGSEQSPHKFLYFFNNAEITAIRSQRWKFVVGQHWRTGFSSFEGKDRYGNTHYYDPGLLYDLERDPAENYSFTRENPEVVKQMVRWLEAGRNEFKNEN